MLFIRTVIVLTYAKSYFLGKHFLFAYQRLQYQYALSTLCPVLLYFYGKYICLTENEIIQKRFLCSGISALQECLKSCHASRHGKIYVRRQKIKILVLAGKAVFIKK